MGIHADVAGFYQLAINMSATGKTVRTKASLAVRKTAHDLETEAKRTCPVDTGYLRSTIGVDIPTLLRAVVGPTANYGPFVEYGTSRMSPQPYMGPALDKVAPGFELAVDQLVGDL